MKYRQTARMRTIASTRMTLGRPEGRRGEDRRLEVMLGASCLILATACLILASVLGARTLFSGTKDRDVSFHEASAVNVSTKDSSSKDLKIREAVLQQLRSVSSCDKVTAGVSNGVVVLDGEVPESVDRDAAGYLASTIPGVKEVRNNVTLSALQSTPSRVMSAVPARTITPNAGKASNREKEISHTENADEAKEAKAWIDEGERTLDTGDYGRAIQYFNRALEADPRNPRALRGLRRAKAAQNAETAVLGNRF